MVTGVPGHDLNNRQEDWQAARLQLGEYRYLQPVPNMHVDGRE